MARIWLGGMRDGGRNRVRGRVELQIPVVAIPNSQLFGNQMFLPFLLTDKRYRTKILSK